MKAEDFDRKFDDGENIIEYLDLTKIKRTVYCLLFTETTPNT